MTAYRVTGTLTPDATGDYQEAGTHNGQPYYRRGADDWYILWYTLLRGGGWGIANALIPPLTLPNWARSGDGIVGEYSPVRDAVGTASVAESTPTPTTYATLTINDGPHAGRYVVLRSDL